MLSESHPFIRRILRFFALPYCYIYLVNWPECSASRFQVFKDFLYIFFRLKYYPDNYSPCRFWEQDRNQWNLYYGSSYDPHQRSRLRKEVQRFEYLYLFDDKEICNLLCRGISSVRMPEYYGVIPKESDYRSNIRSVFDSKSCEKIIIKPVTGSAGKGIVMAEMLGGSIYIKDGLKKIPLSEFQLGQRSIMQEVVIQHADVASIAPGSVNTIRLVTLYTTEGESIVISTSMRYGVGNAFIDNWSAGGIAVGMDHHSGILGDVAYDKKGNIYYKHPVTEFYFKGFKVPYWEEIVNMAEEIQAACPFFKLLGMDIAITENGPVLIEVNPSTDIIFQEQTAGPLLKDKRTWREFLKYDILVNDYQRRLYKDID